MLSPSPHSRESCKSRFYVFRYMSGKTINTSPSCLCSFNVVTIQFFYYISDETSRQLFYSLFKLCLIYMNSSELTEPPSNTTTSLPQEMMMKLNGFWIILGLFLGLLAPKGYFWGWDKVQKMFFVVCSYRLPTFVFK